MLRSLLCIGILLPVIQSIHMDNDFELHHAEPVLDFRVVGHNEGPNAIEHGHHQPHADEIQVSFNAFGKDWDFELFVDHHMFSEKSVFSFYGKDDDGNDDVYHMKPHHTLYKTKPNVYPRASFNIYDDQTVHAMIGTNEGAYVIDPASHFPEFNLSSTMGMYHDDDLHHEKSDILPKFSRSLLQNPNSFKDDNARVYATTPFSADDTGTPTKWINCYPGDNVGEKKFGMGMAITAQYYDQVATKGVAAAGKPLAAQNHIKNLLADSNTIYAPQMGVHLYVEIAHIRTAPGTGAIGGITAPWNLAQPAQARNSGCVNPQNQAETASDTLGKLRTWRQNEQPNNAGLWHLMTTCFPAPGTVGIAYLNAICTNRVGSGLSSSLSAANPGSRAIWKVVAHEIGHNFGGGHSFELGQGRTGGIMDYGDGKLNGVYQFNSQFRKLPMCQLIAARMAQPQTQVCFANYPQANGKTYVWVDGTPSACPVTCQVTGQPVPQITTPKVCKEAPGTTGAVVADNLCPPPKPQASTSPCPGLPACATNVCGDGRLGGTEQCDSFLPNTQTFDSTCCNPPSSVGVACTTKTTSNCLVNMDACFVSIKNLKTYCFRGNSYNRYSPGSATRDASYPRNIAQYWSLPTGFDSDIDAIVQRKEGRIYLLKGAQYAVYEFGFGVHNQGLAYQDASVFFGWPPAWTKVDAAVSLNSGQGGAYLFNAAAKEYCRFNFAPGGDPCSATVRPINDWNGGAAFPLETITAARRYWPEIGLAEPSLNLAVDLMHNGQYVRYTFGQGLDTTMRTSQAFGAAATTAEPVAQRCSSGCFDCSDNPAICSICEQDYQLVSGNCYPIEYVIEMLFNTLTFNSDKEYVLSTTVANNFWNTQPGNTGNACTLTSTDNIILKASKFPKNMEDWEFHFWVSITSDPGVAINMVSGSLLHAGVPYHFSFYLERKMDGSFNPVPDVWIPTYKLVKNPMTTPTTISLASDFEVAARTFVHLIASLKQGNMEITIDGGTLSIPYDDAQASTNTQIAAWEFLRFEIGKSTIPTASSYSGIPGYLDQFHVDLLTESELASSMAVLRPFSILYVVAALAFTLY